MEENKKKKIIVAIIGVLTLLVVLGGATLAFFSATDTEEAKQITTAKEELDVKIEGPTHVSNIKPTIWHEKEGDNLSNGINTGNTDIVQIPITVTNKSTIDINFDLTVSLNNLKLNEEGIGGNTSDIKYRLYGPHTDPFSHPFINLYGDFENPTYNQKIIKNYLLSSGKSMDLKLFIYIEDTGEEQNKLQGIDFDVEIKASSSSFSENREDMLLVDAIMKDNDIKERNPIFKGYSVYDYQGSLKNDFITLHDRGLYKILDEDIYYFRGDVDNNYVIFGVSKNINSLGYPLTWRIMRVNKDKSITLILDNTVDNVTSETVLSKYNSNNETKYNGSDIQSMLNEWYKSHIQEEGLDDMVVNTDFCNDTNYENVLSRLDKDIPEPTLDCDEENKITSKVGLVTADEMVFAGKLYNKKIKGDTSSNNYPYLHSTYTMTAASNNEVIGDSNGYEMKGSNILESINFNPVITLKANTKLSPNKTYIIDSISMKTKSINIGTFSSPYIIG